VFGSQSADEIGRVAGRVGLDVVQLHGHTDADRVTAIRRVFGGRVWTVLRVTNHLPDGAMELADACDGLVLDTLVSTALGGTGQRFDWAAVSRSLVGFRTSTPIVLAGGLRPDNVRDAIASFVPPPEVVDVSSGVESAPGIKNADRMRAFRDAVALASISH
jgi:phosphoribosylanthranilate isomerase